MSNKTDLFAYWNHDEDCYDLSFAGKEFYSDDGGKSWKNKDGYTAMVGVPVNLLGGPRDGVLI